MALDEQRVARGRPVERLNRGSVEQLARKAELVIDDPQPCRRAIGGISRERDPMVQRLQCAGAEAESGFATELVAVDIGRADVDRDLVCGVGKEELRGRDDRAPVVGRVELDVEGNFGQDRDRILQVHRIHAARELDAEIGGGIHARIAIGRQRACESRRPLGHERPVVAKRVCVAGGVAVAGLEDDLVVRVGEKGHVIVGEGPAADPRHGADRRGGQAKARGDRCLVDVVVKRDADRRRGRDIDRVALRRVVDDLRGVASARRQSNT